MIRHIVAGGQTPAELARHYGVSLEELVALNGLERDLPVPEGLMLWVPEPPGRQAGETPAEPVLTVSPEDFSALASRADGGGAVAIRIVRGRPGQPLTLQFS